MATRAEKAQARNEKFLARLQKADGRKITLSALPFERADGKTRKQVQGRQSALAQQFREWARERGYEVETGSRTTETSVRIFATLVSGPDWRSAAWNRAEELANGQRTQVSAPFIERRTAPAAAPEAPLLSETYVKFLNKALASDKIVSLQARSARPADVARLTEYYEDLVSLAAENSLPVAFKLYKSRKTTTLSGGRA